MGKKSIKENKNIYQITREELGLTRDKASELLEYISSDRIEKIESEKSLPHPDEVLKMSKCYKKPEMCNYYCTHECEIGRETMQIIKPKDLYQVAIQIEHAVNELYRDRERFVGIVEDGKITEDEIEDFKIVQKQLRYISQATNSLNLLIQKMIYDNEISEEAYLGNEEDD